MQSNNKCGSYASISGLKCKVNLPTKKIYIKITVFKFNVSTDVGIGVNSCMQTCEGL